MKYNTTLDSENRKQTDPRHLQTKKLRVYRAELALPMYVYATIRIVERRTHLMSQRHKSLDSENSERRRKRNGIVVYNDNDARIRLYVYSELLYMRDER